jgi:8-oxo-dGTP diphosphatase
MLKPLTDAERNRRLKKLALGPEDLDPNGFPIFRVTCDIVIFTMSRNEPHVLLIKRSGDVFPGMWALPGGFKQPEETLDETANRELLEETNFQAPTYLRQFKTYGDPFRDPRKNVVTIAYLAVVPEVSKIKGGTDAADAQLFPVKQVLDGELPLAFDHHEIVRDAYEHVQVELETSDIATSFVPEEFTLLQLRSVYESFWGSKFDGANFRRNLLDGPKPYVDELYVDEPGIDGPHKKRNKQKRRKTAPSPPGGGRPAQLFTKSDSWKSAGPPIRRRQSRSR